jgi:outer membrane lipoprotein-sorting protein
MMKKNQLVRYLTLIIVILFFSFTSVEGKPSSKEEIMLLKDIVAYLNSIQSIDTNFEQVSGRIKQFGRFLLKRPGQMKLEYFKPEHIVIAKQSNKLAIYNYSLDELTYTSIGSSPIAILLKSHINFGKDAIITSIYQDQEVATITMRTPENENATLTIVLGKTKKDSRLIKNNVILKQIIITDQESSQQASINLLTPKINSPINDTLLQFKNPRYHQDFSKQAR